MNLDRLKSKVGYLAGPMTGIINYNYPEFTDTAKLLRDSGLSILNPAEHFGGDMTLPREMYLRAAIHAVLSADYVVLLPHWQQSSGACFEVDIALGMGLPLFEMQLFDPACSDAYSRTWDLKRLPAATQPRPAREPFDPTCEAV